MTHFLAKIYFSFVSVFKSKKKKLALTFLYCLGHETRLDDSRKSIDINQSISLTWENSKIFNIISKYFSVFNKKPPAS